MNKILHSASLLAILSIVGNIMLATYWNFRNRSSTTNTILVFCEIREYKNNALERALFYLLNYHETQQQSGSLLISQRHPKRYRIRFDMPRGKRLALPQTVLCIAAIAAPTRPAR